MSSTQTKYFVEKMKCDGCITNCKNALADVLGVEKAEFDLETGTAVVAGDVDPQAVCQALTAAGYPSVVNSGS